MSREISSAQLQENVPAPQAIPRANASSFLSSSRINHSLSPSHRVSYHTREQSSSTFMTHDSRHPPTTASSSTPTVMIELVVPPPSIGPPGRQAQSGNPKAAEPFGTRCLNEALLYYWRFQWQRERREWNAGVTGHFSRFTTYSASLFSHAKPMNVTVEEDPTADRLIKANSCTVSDDRHASRTADAAAGGTAEDQR
ncbi:unnamed protein product [Calypogeia fissa]